MTWDRGAAAAAAAAFPTNPSCGCRLSLCGRQIFQGSRHMNRQGRKIAGALTVLTIRLGRAFQQCIVVSITAVHPDVVSVQ